MKQLNASIRIHASKERVWQTVTNRDLYQMWTESFSPGSDYEGSWEKGAKILFYGVNEYGEKEGMSSEIADTRPYEYISIRHVGLLLHGKEDNTSEKAKKWTPSYENYSLKEESPDVILFSVEQTVPEEMSGMFTDMWNTGLLKLKEVAETGTSNTVSIMAYVKAPLERVWNCYNEPEHVTQWAFASDDWEAPSSTNDLRVGGKFTTRMASKDGKHAFDFSGVYTAVDPQKEIRYGMEDGRKVSVTFDPQQQSVKVVVTFDIEHENPRYLQRDGWQAILNNFKKYTEQSA